MRKRISVLLIMVIVIIVAFCTMKKEKNSEIFFRHEDLVQPQIQNDDTIGSIAFKVQKHDEEVVEILRLSFSPSEIIGDSDEVGYFDSVNIPNAELEIRILNYVEVSNVKIIHQGISYRLSPMCNWENCGL